MESVPWTMQGLALFPPCLLRETSPLLYASVHACCLGKGWSLCLRLCDEVTSS